MANDITIEEIANALRADIQNLVYGIGLQGKIEGNEFVAYNPTRADKHLGSFRICIRGAKQGLWCEFAGNDRGDPIDLINYCLFHNDINKHEAIEWGKSFLGLGKGDVTLKQVKKRAEEQKNEGERLRKIENENYKKYAQKIYLEAQETIKGTPAEFYFNARGIDFNILGKQPHALRYGAKVYYGKDQETMQDLYYPAVVTAIHGQNNEFVGVHRTYLEQINGVWRRKNKKVLGSFAGGAIRIWRGKTGLPIAKLEKEKNLDDDDLTLVVCEGIEDALSLAMACPQFRIWTSISVSNMRNLEIPGIIKNIIIAADNDGEGTIASQQVEAAAQTFIRAGKTVRVARPKKAHDFNDMLTGKDYKHS